MSLRALSYFSLYPLPLWREAFWDLKEDSSAWRLLMVTWREEELEDWALRESFSALRVANCPWSNW